MKNLQEFNITEDVAKRVEWINKRVPLTEIQKSYIDFQIKEAIINVLRLIDNNK